MFVWHPVWVSPFGVRLGMIKPRNGILPSFRTTPKNAHSPSRLPRLIAARVAGCPVHYPDALSGRCVGRQAGGSAVAYCIKVLLLRQRRQVIFGELGTNGLIMVVCTSCWTVKAGSLFSDSYQSAIDRSITSWRHTHRSSILCPTQAREVELTTNLCLI